MTLIVMGYNTLVDWLIEATINLSMLYRVIKSNMNAQVTFINKLLRTSNEEVEASRGGVGQCAEGEGGRRSGDGHGEEPRRLPAPGLFSRTIVSR